MLFHDPDRTCKRLSGCWKRCHAFASKGCVDPEHPLAAMWENAKFFIDVEAPAYESGESIADYEKRLAEHNAFSITILDWVALKIEGFAQGNLLAGDATIAAILYEWRERMTFDPTK